MAGLPYNGCSELIRHGRNKHYYHAQRHKLLPQTPECTICSCDLPSGCIPYHAEEYGPTLEDYWASCVPLCHRCHAMLHARFVTPNRWNHYVAQAMTGQIDDDEYPLSRQIAPMLSRFKSKADIGTSPLPEIAPNYVLSLSLIEYNGPPKPATLLVIDQRTKQVVEIPDWTLYGEGLEKLNAYERSVLKGRGIDVNGFLHATIEIERDKAGRLKYRRLYT